VRRVAETGTTGIAADSTDHTTRSYLQRRPAMDLGIANNTAIPSDGSDTITENTSTTTTAIQITESLPTASCDEYRPTAQNNDEMNNTLHEVDNVSGAPELDLREFIVNCQAVVTETDPVVVNDVGGENPISSVDVYVSPLKYVNVSIAVDDENVAENVLGVCDSGAEMCVIRAVLVARHFPAVVGQVVLCPFYEQPIVADVMSRLTNAS